MKLVTLALVAPLVLSGCATPQKDAAEIDKTCRQYSAFKSDAYYSCFSKLSESMTAQREFQSAKLRSASDAFAKTGAAFSAIGAAQEQSAPVFIAPTTVRCTSRRVGPNVESTCY